MGRKPRAEEPKPAPLPPRPPLGRVDAALFAVALAVYLATMARGPSWGDSCELALVADTLSTAHPTGYPLYTLLGWFASKLPLGPLCVRVTLLSAVPVAAAAVLVYRLALRAVVDPRAAAAAALAFAFFQEPWSQALVPEVYGLHLALAAAILVALARLLEEPSPARLHVLAALGGVSFAHHMQTVFLVPAALAGILAVPAARALLTRSAIPRVLALGAAPLSLYLLLVVRAYQQPFVDQAQATSLWALLSHLTGRQFAYRMFGGSEPGLLGREIVRLGRELIAQASAYTLLSLPLLALAALGLAPTARRARPLAVALATAAMACVLYTVNYRIPDKSAYYLTLYLAVAVALAAGVDAALARAHHAALLALVVAIPLVTNYPVTTRASDTSLSDYAADLMKLTPPDSLFVTDDLTLWWGLVYRQEVEGLDRDRALLCTYPMRLPWYLPFVQRRHPRLTVPAGLAAELSGGLAALEASGDPTGTRSQALVDQLTTKLVAANLARPVTLAIHQTADDLKSWSGWPLQSLGLAYRVLEAPAAPAPYPTDYANPERHRVGEVHGVDQLRVARRYATALNRLGILHIQQGSFAEAEQAFRRALDYDARYAQVLTNLGVLYADHMHRPADAYPVYRRFMELFPDDKQAPAVARWLGDYQSKLIAR